MTMGGVQVTMGGVQVTMEGVQETMGGVQVTMGGVQMHSCIHLELYDMCCTLFHAHHLMCKWDCVP